MTGGAVVTRGPRPASRTATGRGTGANISKARISNRPIVSDAMKASINTGPFCGKDGDCGVSAREIIRASGRWISRSSRAPVSLALNRKDSRSPRLAAASRSSARNSPSRCFSRVTSDFRRAMDCRNELSRAAATRTSFSNRLTILPTSSPMARRRSSSSACRAIMSGCCGNRSAESSVI